MRIGLPLVAAVLAISCMSAMADPPGWAPAHGWRKHKHHYDDDFPPPPPAVHVIAYDDRIYRGRDGRYYCHRSDGTMGLVAGAAIGGIIGNRLSRGHSETLGTLLGAGAGAIVGQQIDQGSLHCE